MIKRNKTITLSIAMAMSVTMLGGISNAYALNVDLNNEAIIEVSQEEDEVFEEVINEKEN